jgi:integrase
MYACGLRISEAASLEVGAIDSANMLLRIIGKGNKERHVPLPQSVLAELRSLWLTHRNPRWLFPARRGAKPVEHQVLCRTFRAAALAAGITQRATPHALRHYVSFLTMSGNVAGSGILIVNHRSQHVAAWPATRHSLLGATSRPESLATDPRGDNETACHSVVRFWSAPVPS